VTTVVASAWSTIETGITLTYLAAAVTWYLLDRRRPRHDRRFTPLANAVLVAFGIVLALALLLAIAS
jgi:hypothetical protein